jgi:hypothetical protein
MDRHLSLISIVGGISYSCGWFVATINGFYDRIKNDREKQEYEPCDELDSLSFVKEKHTPLNLRLLLARSTLNEDSILNELPFDLIQMIGEKISSVYIEEIPISTIIKPQFLPPGVPTEMDDGHGNTLVPTKCFMISHETEHLYKNKNYFTNLSFSSDAPHSYFRCKDGKCAPATWGSDVNEHYDKDHPSNIDKLLPTFHELEAMIDTHDCKLWGTFTILDTRVSEYDPPITTVRFTGWDFEGGITKKVKLLPDWHIYLNKEKNKFFYWKKKHSQWRNPCHNLMDIMEMKKCCFYELSENFTKNIHGNMDFKNHNFYDLLGLVPDNSSPLHDPVSNSSPQHS